MKLKQKCTLIFFKEAKVLQLTIMFTPVCNKNKTNKSFLNFWSQSKNTKLIRSTNINITGMLIILKQYISYTLTSYVYKVIHSSIF